MELLSIVGAYVSIGLLLFSGLSHLRYRRQFREALGKQEVWNHLEGPIASVIILLEVSIGVVGFFFLLGLLSRAVLVSACFGAFVIYFSYGSFSIYLVRRRPDAPCGCSIDEEPANVWTAVRAGALALAAAIGALGGERVPSVLQGSFQSLFSLLASCALALLIWELPSALAQPHRRFVPAYLGRDTLVPRENT